MNPIVITGMLAVAVASVAVMAELSGEQARHAAAAERMAGMHSERIREEASLSVRDGRLVVENSGTVGIRILEVRTVDDRGLIESRHPVDVAVAPAGEADLGPAPPGAP